MLLNGVVFMCAIWKCGLQALPRLVLASPFHPGVSSIMQRCRGVQLDFNPDRIRKKLNIWGCFQLCPLIVLYNPKHSYSSKIRYLEKTLATKSVLNNAYVQITNKSCWTGVTLYFICILIFFTIKK